MAELKDRQQQETEGKPQFHSHLMLIGCVSASLKVLNLQVYMQRIYCINLFQYEASLVAQLVKEHACNAGDPGLIPGSGRSPGEGNGNPLQYSCLENPMDCSLGSKESDTAYRLNHHHSSTVLYS